MLNSVEHQTATTGSFLALVLQSDQRLGHVAVWWQEQYQRYRGRELQRTQLSTWALGMGRWSLYGVDTFKYCTQISRIKLWPDKTGHQGSLANDADVRQHLEENGEEAKDILQLSRMSFKYRLR